MAVTKENYERFLQSLKENRQQFTWGEGERKSTQAPDGSDPHKMLMSDLAHQREILAGQPVNDFIAGYKGDVDFEDLSRQGHLSCTIMKRRPTIPTAVVRGVLMNRGVSMTQILQGDISKELQEQVAAEFQEACSDDKKMGTLIAEAVKGACSMDINREMNEALLGKDPREPMTPEQVQEVMGTEEGRLLSGLYLCGFRNIGQELKQLGEELMLNNQIGVSYHKQPQIMSRGVAGDAIMEEFSDQDLSDYWRMTRLTDALGAKGADPDMLLGFYSSQFYNPALPNPCGLRHYKETQMPMEEKTYGALFAGLLTQEVATEMSQKGRAGLAGASPRKYYEARSAEVKAEQELLSRQDTEDMLKNPQISAQAKKYLLDPDDRLEREIAFAHEQIDMDVRSTIISGPAGLRDAMKLFVPKISEERLDKEMSTPIAITLHPYGMSDLSVQQRMEYAGYCRKYAENMLKACQKFEAERKELEQKIFDAQQAAGGAEPDTEEYRKDHERLQQLRAFIDPRKQKAQALEGKARIAESIDRPKEALSYNPDELLDNPTLRPQVLAKLREIGKKESFVMDVMSTMRAEENERRRREGKPELEANDFALGDYRDIPKMCIVPDEILSKKDQEEYIRNWLSEWRSGPEGKNRILTEYFDRMDALAVRDGDLSCLTAEDKTETLSDGLTQSEHDFLDMLTLERNTQSRNIKGYQRNPEFFRAHYNSDKARTMYFLECDKDVMGYGQYFPIICAMNGFQISTLEDNTWGTPICTASTRGVGKELQKFDRERAALLGVEQPQERVEKLLYPPETIQRVYDPAHPEVSQEMIADYQESLLAAIQQFERGEPIKQEEAGRIESFFRENVAAISGTRSETSATLQKEYGLDETDLLFVDGKPLKEFVGDRFGDYDSKTGNEKLQMKRQLLATYMVAAVSGKHRTEAVSLVRNGQEVPKTVVVPIRLDAHSMDEIEKKSEHNGLRRIFDFALTKIETRATKQDALWKNDPEKATRRAAIESLTAAKLEQNAADRQLKEANPDKDPKEQEKADAFTLPPLMPVPEIVVEKEEPEKPKAEAVEEKPEVEGSAADTEEPEKPKAEAVEEKPEVKYAASHSLCVDPKQIRALGQILDKLDSKEAASPWYHKDSEEYTGMHDALKAFREKTAGLDLLDPAHNARISLMMEDVYQAAEKYAATLSTRERKSTSGEIRRNAVQSILETVTRQPGKDISLSGESLLASITGTDPQKLRNADDLYHAMDTLFINGISATSYFKAVAPELHIDDEKQELAADAAEKVGDRLRAIFDRAKKDPNASIFVAVEGEDGLLRSVKADASDDAKAKENVEKYNRRADRMCEDLNAARMEALESYRRGKSNDEAGLSREERRQAAIETAIQVSEGTHRKKVGLSGLTKMDNTMPKKNYSELRAAKKAEMEDGKALDSGAIALQTAAGAMEIATKGMKLT